ncbi:hypothetical protein GH714_016770 [Hevea brasiliensis]|uniref:Uncharacterized protein n=1 Tax=Hevea brasiliensis TaxID=3981 RepID=A0A6A6LDT8_HEVBR|nr:hypothetical protein GH714_016770 [Hevea brasiliensis]
MPNTRMDSRVDAIERSLGALEEGMMRMAGEREQNERKAEIRVRIRSQDTGDIFRLMTLAREVERELLHTGMTKTVSEKSPDAGERWSYGSGPSYKVGGMGFSKQVQQQFKVQTDWVGANKEKVQSKVGNIAQKEIQRLPAPPLTQNKSQQQFSNKSRGTRHLSHQEFEEL